MLSPLHGHQRSCPFWPARHLFLSGDVLWHLVILSPVLLFYYFMCVVPLSYNICHPFKGGDLSGFIHKGCSFWHCSHVPLNENMWPLVIRLRLSKITRGRLKCECTVRFAVSCFCHREEKNYPCPPWSPKLAHGWGKAAPDDPQTCR